MCQLGGLASVLLARHGEGVCEVAGVFLHVVVPMRGFVRMHGGEGGLGECRRRGAL